MFNNMKNKIREKTGSDLPKLSVTQKPGLGRHSRQGSETSLSSLVSETPTKEEVTTPTSTTGSMEFTLLDGKSLTAKDLTRLAKREDEWRNRLEKRDADWTKKMEKKETELVKIMEDKEREWRKQEQTLTEDLLKLTRELKEALKVAEESKRKICQYQEDKDQLEGFQMQEMAKIKHLLLAKEQENAENTAALKKNIVLVDSLRAEVNRLRPFEEQVSNFQDDIECLRHTSEQERWQLSSKLAQSEETVRHLKDRVAVLTKRSEAECVALGAKISPDERVQALLGERTLLERRLEEAHVHLSNIKESWSGQIAALETQVGRLSRQAGEEGLERRRAEEMILQLQARLDEEDREKEKLIARAERISAERDNLAQELKNIAQDVAVAKSDNMDLASKVVELEHLYSEIQTKCTRLQEELEREQEKNKDAVEEEKEILINLKAELDQERRVVEEMSERIEKERREKDDALMRNAQMSQEVELARQELRAQHQESDELFKKSSTMEKQLMDKTQELEKLRVELNNVSSEMVGLQTVAYDRATATAIEKDLRQKVNDLENQVADRSKTVRVLQQRLTDMKKTLQRELKAADPGGGEVTSNNHSVNNSRSIVQPTDEDVNFKYLKHVLIKFLTCREYEAQHLTRAVATLLKFSQEEERLLRETLEWRKSWFGSRPRLPKTKPLFPS